MGKCSTFNKKTGVSNKNWVLNINKRGSFNKNWDSIGVTIVGYRAVNACHGYVERLL